jgi:fluoride exporter
VTTALTWAGVAVVGGLAALARFRLDAAVSRRIAGDFPWGTTVVNVLGALLAGVVAGTGLDGGDRVLIAVGALGSFSTFSTWMLETHRLAEDGRAGLAGVNVAAGMAAGLGAAALGWWLGSLL